MNYQANLTTLQEKVASQLAAQAASQDTVKAVDSTLTNEVNAHIKHLLSNGGKHPLDKDTVKAEINVQASQEVTVTSVSNKGLTSFSDGSKTISDARLALAASTMSFTEWKNQLVPYSSFMGLADAELATNYNQSISNQVTYKASSSKAAGLATDADDSLSKGELIKALALKGKKLSDVIKQDGTVERSTLVQLGILVG